MFFAGERDLLVGAVYTLTRQFQFQFQLQFCPKCDINIKPLER